MPRASDGVGEISRRPAQRTGAASELLTVRRIEPEKNPILVVDALAELGGVGLTSTGSPGLGPVG
jgi:hypothetical protein